MSPCGPGHADHDWRVDPNVVLQTVPPKSRLVCPDCGAVTSGSLTARIVLPNPRDPRNWPKFAG